MSKTERYKIHVLVEYKTGGGHGEADAAEEGLRNLIDNSKKFKVLAIWTTASEKQN